MNWLVAIVIGLFTLPIFAQSQQATSTPPFDGGVYTVRPPSGEGWQSESDKNGRFQFKFHNAKLKAWAMVKSEPIPKPIPNVHDALNLLLEQIPRHLEEMNNKVLFFAKDARSYEGADCFSVRAIVDQKMGAVQNTALHLLQCIYGNKIMVELQYLYPTTGKDDPLRPQAEEFFENLHFKKAGTN